MSSIHFSRQTPAIDAALNAHMPSCILKSVSAAGLGGGIGFARTITELALLLSASGESVKSIASQSSGAEARGLVTGFGCCFQMLLHWPLLLYQRLLPYLLLLMLLAQLGAFW
jgi:hypothetical protein